MSASSAPSFKVENSKWGPGMFLETYAMVDRFDSFDTVSVHGTGDHMTVVSDARFHDTLRPFVVASVRIDEEASGRYLEGRLFLSPQDAVKLRDRLTAALTRARRAGAL